MMHGGKLKLTAYHVQPEHASLYHNDRRYVFAVKKLNVFSSPVASFHAILAFS
jgi:hypothetical protein